MKHYSTSQWEVTHLHSKTYAGREEGVLIITFDQDASERQNFTEDIYELEAELILNFLNKILCAKTLDKLRSLLTRYH